MSFFIQYLLHKGLSHATMKVYGAAASFCHECFGDRLVFRHALVKFYLQETMRCDACLYPPMETMSGARGSGQECLQASGTLLFEGVVTK